MYFLDFFIILHNGSLILELLFCLKFWLFCSHYVLDAIKLQLVEAGLVECLLEIVQEKVDSDKEDDIAELKTASDLMVLLLLGGESYLSQPKNMIIRFF